MPSRRQVAKTGLENALVSIISGGEHMNEIWVSGGGAVVGFRGAMKRVNIKIALVLTGLLDVQRHPVHAGDPDPYAGVHVVALDPP